MSIEYLYPNSTERLTQRASRDEEICRDNVASGELGFKDLVDCVNPLQQLPVVGSIYRAVTGDTISAPARLIGGAILGGPIGFIIAAVNAGIEAATGGDIGEHVVSAVTGKNAAAAYEAADALDG